MSVQPSGKEQWSSKIGVILAVSGSAVGLGNFLRFPGMAAAHGGGAFMIPYFISLLLIGIPICWVEWTLGRQGGRGGFHSSPGILHHLIKNPVARFFGTLGLLIPVAIYMYYVYIEAWCLGYAWKYLVGTMPSSADASVYGDHFNHFVGATKNGLMHDAVLFLLIVFTLNFILIYRGLTKGIESFCKVAMPVLIVAAIIVLVRVLTLPPQPVGEPWHIGLARSMPAAEWNALRSRLSGINDKVQVTNLILDGINTSTAPADLAGLADIEQQTRDSHAEIMKTIRDTVEKHNAPLSSGETARIEMPAGYLAGAEAVTTALTIARTPDVANAYKAWVEKVRASLDDDSKWELIRLESAQSGLAKDLGSDKENTRKKATDKQIRYQQLRAKILQKVSPPPAIPGADALVVQRVGAAEVATVERTVRNGLGFMWNPKPAEPGESIFSALGNAEVWLQAAGQIFFSISVGFGIIITYASYLRGNDDVALSGLTATSTNEFCEVCLGGLITIPAAFIFLGATPLAGTPSTLGLGFTTLPAVFEAMPAGRFFGCLWFTMLFAAAITSSLSMLQPAIAFLEEGFGLQRKSSVAMLGLITAIGCLMVVYFSEGLTALDTMDFWIGSFCVYVMATVLVIVFGWVIGVDRGLALADEGAELHIPRFFGFVIKYISPLYLLIIFGFWLYNNAWAGIESIRESEAKSYTVAFLIVVAVFFAVLVSLAAKRWDHAATGDKS